jgi:hypothetical protein
MGRRAGLSVSGTSLAAIAPRSNSELFSWSSMETSLRLRGRASASIARASCQNQQEVRPCQRRLTAIESAWDARITITTATTGEVRDAINDTLNALDSGELRVAESRTVVACDQWAKKRRSCCPSA